MKQQPSIPPAENIIGQTTSDQIIGITKSQKNVDEVVYTRRLVKIIPVSIEDIDEDFDEDEFIKGCYGSDIEIVSKHGIPPGWILVDGTFEISLDTNF